MRIDIPQGQYVQKIETHEGYVDVQFASPKKVALVFICLNDRYWPYIAQVIKDCRKHFLTKHNVDYFVWTDYNDENKKKLLDGLESLVKAWNDAPPEKKGEALGNFLTVFTNIIRLYEHFYAPQLQLWLQELAMQGLFIKRDGQKFWFECSRPVITSEDIFKIFTVAHNTLTLALADMDQAFQGVNLIDTEAVPWPSPTLMRYHLFLNEEEKLKGYDHLFYLDADMRVVGSVGDEIFSEGLTAAEHPMYALSKQYIPPYEPNKDSTAYIKRPGAVVIGDDGKPRFKPYYYAGGFQGGVTSEFLTAMHTMKKNIDKDFDNNYIAIWNDESHWNKYMSEYEGPTVVLSPSYVYPDSLIKEYYEPKWGCSYEPKIITLTKPFTLSAQGAEEVNKMIGK